MSKIDISKIVEAFDMAVWYWEVSSEEHARGETEREELAYAKDILMRAKQDYPPLIERAAR